MLTRSTRILRDISRWSLYVQKNEQPLFEEIASTVWGQKPAHHSSPMEGFSSNSAYREDMDHWLSRFRSLLEELISETTTGVLDGQSIPSGGRRLSSIQPNLFSHSRSSELGSEVCHPYSESQPPDRGKRDNESQSEQRSQDSAPREELDPRVVLLLTGAIWAAILGFLIGK